MAYMVGRLGAAMDNPSDRHWKIMKRVLWYIAATSDHGLMFKKKKRLKKAVVAGKTRKVEASSDRDW